MKAPFPTERIVDGTPKLWLEWLREHGTAQIGFSPREMAKYWQSTFLPWHKDKTKEQQLCFVKELGFAKEWAEAGFPQVVVGDKLFASFAATRIPSDAAPDLGLPWECFVIRIPDRFRADMPMVQVNPDGSTGNSFVDRSAYMRVRRNWKTDATADDWGDSSKKNGWVWSVVPTMMPWSESSLQFHELSGLLRELSADRLTRHDLGADGRNHDSGVECTEEQDSQYKRLMVSMRRAFSGVVIEMMSPKKHSGSGGRDSRSNRRCEGPANGSTVVLTRPVVVDCRDWLENHLRKNCRGRELAVQTLVRGHWKRQVCGVGGLERKYLHIEPYWRGPEDAPIAVRAHRLEGAL